MVKLFSEIEVGEAKNIECFDIDTPKNPDVCIVIDDPKNIELDFEVDQAKNIEGDLVIKHDGIVQLYMLDEI